MYFTGRFRGRVSQDCRGNTVFPHLGEDRELCGFEAKNERFTGFAKGGTKGLFVGRWRRGLRVVAVVESAVEALNLAAPFPSADAGLTPTGGAMRPKQPALFRHLFAQLPRAGRSS